MDDPARRDGAAGGGRDPHRLREGLHPRRGDRVRRLHRLQGRAGREGARQDAPRGQGLRRARTATSCTSASTSDATRRWRRSASRRCKASATTSSCSTASASASTLAPRNCGASPIAATASAATRSWSSKGPRGADVDFRYRIWNADGGEVEQCGNGARCFVQFVREQGLTTKDRIRVETAGGIIVPRDRRRRRGCGRHGRAALRAAAEIPFAGDGDAAVLCRSIVGGANDRREPRVDGQSARGAGRRRRRRRARRRRRGR